MPHYYDNKPTLSQFIAEYPDRLPRRDIYPALGITEADDEFIRVFDSCGPLVLIHYIDPQPQVQHLRGVIFDISVPSIVCGTFPHTEEVPRDDPLVTEFPYSDDTVLTQAYEGTVLRLYYSPHAVEDESPEEDDNDIRRSYRRRRLCPSLPDGWSLATYKRLDCSNSHWNKTYFLALFMRLWGETSFDQLDKNVCYCFLVQHPKIRMCRNIRYPHLYYVASFSVKKQLTGELKSTRDRETADISFDIGRPITTVVPIQVTSYDDLPPDNDIEENSTGLLLYDFSSGKSVKVITQEYRYQREVVGENANPVVRYLELRQQGREQELVNMFPEKKSLFDLTESNLRDLINYLCSLYRRRYAQGEFVETSPEIHYIISRVLLQRQASDQVVLPPRKSRWDRNSSKVKDLGDPREDITLKLAEASGHRVNKMLRHFFRTKRERYLESLNSDSDNEQ